MGTRIYIYVKYYGKYTEIQSSLERRFYLGI